MREPSHKELLVKARRFYPQSEKMQRTWIENTQFLYRTGRHAFLTGGWKREGYHTYECI